MVQYTGKPYIILYWITVIINNNNFMTEKNSSCCLGGARFASSPAWFTLYPEAITASVQTTRGPMRLFNVRGGGGKQIDGERERVIYI
jgi:hypothetical protein